MDVKQLDLAADAQLVATHQLFTAVYGLSRP